MFTVYSEKNIFEEIVIYNDRYKNWYHILGQHAEICLNMTDEELIENEVPGTPIFEFIHSNGGKRPIALMDYFDLINNDNSQIAEKPRSVFFFNYSKEKAEVMQSDYGVIVISAEKIDDEILRGSYFKELPMGKVIDNQAGKGWKGLVTSTLPPSNALVITDEYLFSNEENGVIIGEANLLGIVDTFLPSTLNTDYHIAVFANDEGKSKEWCERLTERLGKSIKSLRSYSIVFEVVFTKTIHKRKMILNYLNTTCDKGYAIFKVADKRTVRDNNDFRSEKIFNRLYPHEGDTDYESVENVLLQLKKKTLAISQYINASGSIMNYRIMGDCNENYTLRNRLLNDI